MELSHFGAVLSQEWLECMLVNGVFRKQLELKSRKMVEDVSKKNIIISNLQKLDYSLKIKENLIEVYLGFGLIAEIKEQDSKIKIVGLLKPWNPITGFFKTEILRSIKLTSILIFVCLVILFLSTLDGFPPSNFILCLTVLLLSYTILWYFYFITLFYIFKNKIETLLITN